MSDKLIYKNELCELYENDMTKMITEYCTKKNALDLMPLENHRVFLVNENGHKTYVLYEMAYPVYASTSVETMGAHIDMLRFNLTKDTLSEALLNIKENNND